MGKSPNKKPPQSDIDTKAIAPSDYEHIFSSKEEIKKGGQKTGAQKPPASDIETKAIAPSDYEHIFSSKEDIKKNASPAGKARRQQDTSDLDTKAIAPSDYQHIFSSKTQVNKGAKGGSSGTKASSARPSSARPSKAAPASDLDTKAIAPSDYEHIFSSKTQVNKGASQAAPSRANRRPAASSSGKYVSKPSPPASDIDTKVIAPSDYQHIYSSKEQIRSKPKQSDVSKPPVSGGFESGSHQRSPVASARPPEREQSSGSTQGSSRDENLSSQRLWKSSGGYPRGVLVALEEFLNTRVKNYKISEWAKDEANRRKEGR